MQLAKLILQVDEHQKAECVDDANEAKAKLAGLIRDFGVKLMPEHENDDDLAAAVAYSFLGIPIDLCQVDAAHRNWTRNPQSS